MMGNALARFAPYYPSADPRVAFWSREGDWPEDSKDQIFAARALIQLGKLTMPDADIATSAATPLVAELPRELSLYTPLDEIRRGIDLLARDEESPRSRTPRGLAAPYPPSEEHPFPSRTEWARAVHLAKIAVDLAWTSYLPFAKAAIRLAIVLADGQVTTFTRPARGGEPEARAWHFWNGDGMWRRFYTCRINDADPFDSTPAISGSWLYIDRASFDAYLHGKPESHQLPSVNPDALKAAARPERKGRPQKRGWDYVIAELIRVMHHDGIPDASSDTELGRRVLDILTEEGVEDLPDIESVRKRIAIIRSRVGRLD